MRARRLTLFATLVCVAGAFRLHAAFTSEQAYTFFSDRFMAYSTEDIAIPRFRPEASEGVFAVHADRAVHIFCHTDDCVYRCMWGAPMTPLQKMHIIKGLKAWHASLARNSTVLSWQTSNAEDTWAWGSG